MKMKWLCIFSLALNLGCQTTKKIASPPAADLSEILMKDVDSRTMIGINARHLSPAEAAQLEKYLEKVPDDVETHIQLLGFYNSKKYTPGDDQKKYTEQLEWIISHRPLDPIVLSFFFYIETKDGNYTLFKEKWLSLLRAEPDNYGLRLSLARALAVLYRDEADKLLLEGLEIFPNDIGLHRERFRLYDVHTKYVKPASHDYEIAVQELKFLEHNIPSKLHWSSIADFLVEYAYFSGDLKLAKKKAEAHLKEAVENHSDHSFGFGVATARTILGLIAMDEGNYGLAKENLEKSVTETPVSVSFGPTFVLAKRLLAVGERAAVRQYLADYENIWMSGSVELQKWKTEIDNGQMPTLDKFEKYIRKTASEGPKIEH